MKVQVPANDIIESEFQDFVENAGPKKIGVREAFERGVTSGIAQANEQLATTPHTKRPFLSDEEIDDEVKDFDYAEDRELYRTAARWARDKYEARYGGDVPNVEPTQTFYVIKRNEEPAYWYYLDTWDQSMERCFLSGDNLQSQIDYVRKNNPTARIVKVMVSEVEG